MALRDYSPLFEALSSDRRRELFEFISKFNFVSKNDLVIKFNMKRANLNHHLESMIKAGLIHELSLILDGRKHTFLIPAVKIFPKRLVEDQKETQDLIKQLRIWTDRNLTLNNWNVLRESLRNLPEDLVTAVELRLFPTIGTRDSIDTNYCFVCHTNKAQKVCYTCKNLVCQVHAYKIDREELGAISLCPNCVSKFFG
jgi:DNA-binding transcriptional ArsR family regulator